MLRQCMHDVINLYQSFLLKLSETLHVEYRYNEHVHEEVSCQSVMPKKNFFFFLQSDCLSY